MANYLHEMIDRLSATPPQRITDEDVRFWAGGLANDDFYNSVNLAIAEQYQAGLLSYAVCAAIMNDLWSVVLIGLGSNVLPDPFYDIYEAFDAGEYYRTPDKSDDPQSDFTKSMIAEILARMARH